MDAVIVGGGVAGLSLAVHLAERGWRVRVYEAEYPGYGASGRSAGILVTILPPPLLDMALETLGFYRSLPGSEGRVGPRAALWVPEDPRCAERVLSWHASAGLPFRERVNAREALGVEYRVEGESHEITEFLVDTGWVVNALQARAAELGVEVAAGRVSKAGPGYVELEGGGRIEAGAVVVAAGPWTPRLAPWIAGSTLVYRCQLASVEGPTPRLIVEDDEAGFYLVPVSATRFNIGDGANPHIGDPMDGFSPDREDTLRVMEAYASRNPAAWESRLVQEWAAPCIVGRDSMPIAANVNGVYVLTGFDGAGITLAPAAARVLADHLVHGSRLPAWLSRLERVGEGVAEPYDVCRRRRAKP